uniref:Clan AA aspartic protease n=1 Tax=Phenylobacterium glaciei TaxID=2803784 RepID=A0A974P395_9CAUL|nr:clan AA aspartic protease [Phenylobacterium glaciei]
MTGFDQTRRGLIAGLAATGPLAACATALPSPRRMIQVNLTDTPLPPVTAPSPPPPAPDTALQAGFDPVQRMTVPVMVEGKGPFTFVVDTGANHSVLAAETAQGLNLPSGGTAAIHGIAGVEPAETVYVRQMIIGSVVTKRLRMPLVSRRNLGADGLLGVDVLTRRDVQLDFERNRFNIARSDSSFRQVATTGGTGRLATPWPIPTLSLSRPATGSASSPSSTPRWASACPSPPSWIQAPSRRWATWPCATPPSCRSRAWP